MARSFRTRRDGSHIVDEDFFCDGKGVVIVGAEMAGAWREQCPGCQKKKGGSR